MSASAEVVRLVAAAKSYVSPRGLAQPAAHPAFGPIDLVLHRSETVALVGRSGAGKSSLARCLAGLEPLSQGRRFLSQGLPATAIQLVFQDSPTALNPHWSLDRLLREPLLLTNGDTSKANLIAQLGRVGLPPELLPRKPHQLSGGQRRRLLIARALAVPHLQLLILDEPLAGLDPISARAILSLLTGLQAATHLSLLLITHDLQSIATIADRLLVLHQGCIVEQLAGRSALESAHHPESRALIGAMLPHR